MDVNEKANELTLVGMGNFVNRLKYQSMICCRVLLLCLGGCFDDDDLSILLIVDQDVGVREKWARQ